MFLKDFYVRESLIYFNQLVNWPQISEDSEQYLLSA
jgi:hypothetical protein